MTKITIGITSYNQIEMLTEAVNSILNQSYKDFHIIIGHDNPQNKISFSNLGLREHSKITIINNPINLGEVENMNFLLNQSKTKWFSWLADDDLWHKDFLESNMEYLDNANADEIAGIYTNYSSGKLLNENFNDSNNDNNNYIRFRQNQFIDWYINNPKQLIGCYGIMKTEYLKNISGHPKLGNSFGPYSDDLVPILLSEYGSISWINRKLVFLRTHKDSRSVLSTDISAYTSAQDEFLKEFKTVCESNNYLKMKITYYQHLLITKRFMLDDFSVLLRNKNISFRHKANKYLKIQLSRLRELNYFFRIIIFIHIFYIPVIIILKKLVRKLI